MDKFGYFTVKILYSSTTCQLLMLLVGLLVDENAGLADPEFIDAPIFKQPGEPLHASQPLRWNHKACLLGFL